MPCSLERFLAVERARGRQEQANSRHSAGRCRPCSKAPGRSGQGLGRRRPRSPRRWRRRDRGTDWTSCGVSCGAKTPRLSPALVGEVGRRQVRTRTWRTSLLRAGTVSADRRPTRVASAGRSRVPSWPADFTARRPRPFSPRSESECRHQLLSALRWGSPCRPARNGPCSGSAPVHTASA